MKVVWTDRAKARLRQIHRHIARDQVVNADLMVDRLTRRTDQLIEHPRSGRVLPSFQREDVRELVEAPYRLVYLILADRIVILSVRDTRRVLPRRLEDF